MCRSRMYAPKGNSNSCPLGLIIRMERHVVSTASGGASITSRFLTLGRSLSISALTGKYSPHRTGVPRILFFSKTFTFKPFFDRWTAAESPPGPPPTMTTSYLLPLKLQRSARGMSNVKRSVEVIYAFGPVHNWSHDPRIDL